MKFRLRILGEPNHNERVFDRALCVIGRMNSDLLLADPYCSSKHAKIFTNFDGRLWIKDMASRNGVFVNGKKVGSSPLAVGDHIRIGHTEIELVEDCMADPRGPLNRVLTSSDAGVKVMKVSAAHSF